MSFLAVSIRDFREYLGPKRLQNIRILQTMVSGILLVLGFGTRVYVTVRTVWVWPEGRGRWRGVGVVPAAAQQAGAVQQPLLSGRPNSCMHHANAPSLGMHKAFVWNIEDWAPKLENIAAWILREALAMRREPMLADAPRSSCLCQELYRRYGAAQ